MTLLFWLAVVASIGGVMTLCFCAGFKLGQEDATDAYLEALDWLKAQHEDNERRMRGV